MAKKEMLSVGSGDGSQQLGIVEEGRTNILATFYGTREQDFQKYPHAKEILKRLEQKCKRSPMFSIDATKLHQFADSLGKFDLICFTFPRTGTPNRKSSQNIRTNQALLQGFLTSSRNVLKPSGEIQITLKNGAFYEQRDLVSVAKSVKGIVYCGS